MSSAIRIGILAFPRVQLLDVVGPADVFAEAARQLDDPRAYAVQVIATEAGVLRSSCGLRLAVDATLANQRGRIDTLLVAGSPGMEDMRHGQAVHAWLRSKARSVRRFGSVCTGAFVLGSAGLLEGRRVATHWSGVARLAAENPGARVQSDAIYVKDGNLYTSAGVTAGMDLALALVEEDHGREIALKVARQLVMFLKRPGGQSQFSAHLAAQSAATSSIEPVTAHVLGNLRGDLSVPKLARRAGMSERNFGRVFRAETGMTPAEFVEKARIDRTRRMLEEDLSPLKRIADRVGYASVDAFRRAFVRQVGVTPREYRKQFAQ